MKTFKYLNDVRLSKKKTVTNILQPYINFQI